MDKALAKYVIIVFLSIVIFTAQLAGSAHVPASQMLARHASPSTVTDPPPVVGVWSSACGSFNITITNSACGSLAVSNTISAEVNVTNAPTFNGYEFSLYFDYHTLQWDHTDTHTGTIFANPFTAKEELPVPGTYRLVVINAPGNNSAASGILAHVFFKILKIGVSPLVLAAGIATPSGFAQDGAWTRLVIGNTPIDTTTTDGYFKNHPTRIGPVASFTYSPTVLLAGGTATFNASSSYDPDRAPPAIANYTWDFGAGGSQGGGQSSQSATVTHTFGAAANPLVGNFSVRLTIFDKDDNFTGIKTERIYVALIPFHDITISRLAVSPDIVHAGDNVTITVVIKNLGTFDEHYNFTLTYGPPAKTIAAKTNELIPRNGNISSTISLTYPLSTAGLAPGAYEIDASVAIPVDRDLPDNTQRVVLTILNQGSSQYVYLLVGAVVVAAAVVTVGLFMRRRRRRPEPE